MNIRPYQPSDYEQLKSLYLDSSTYGGQFDENRDSQERLRKRVEADPDAIIVAEEADKLVGTVSLIEDGRVAWLFRFAVAHTDNESEVAAQLCQHALEALRGKGHHQVLVYTPVGNQNLDGRYEQLGFSRGGDYTCYWRDI